MDHDQGDKLLEPAPQEPVASAPLEAAVQELWSAGSRFAESLDRLVPFPTSLSAPADASVVECSVNVSAGGHVAVRIEHHTHLTVDDVAALHQAELRAQGIRLETNDSDPDLTVTSGQAGTAASSTQLSIEDLGSTRQISTAVTYQDFDAVPFLRRHSNWHAGNTPLPVGVSVDRFRLECVDNRYSETITTWYTTTYRLSGVAIERAQRAVEKRLTSSNNWSWVEPKDRVLFLSGPFDAEIHIRQDAGDTLVDFVGEFHVGTPAPAI